MIEVITKRINTYNFEFHNTCYACPEQYDVFLEGKQIGYVRLRWGGLTCYYPGVSGEPVYACSFDDGMKGCFEDDEERVFHIDLIAQSLYNRLHESKSLCEVVG